MTRVSSLETPRLPPGEADTQTASEPSGSSGHPLPPRHLLAGKYRVEGVLGKGGMGVVMAGHQLSLDRPVAIKLLGQHLSESGRQRFTREAMTIARMQSEHVVRVIDAAEEDNLPFIVMERLSGRDLATELAGGPLPAELAIKYVLEACDAIAEAHSLGIVHRDIKPSNLFLVDGANGRRLIKVLDFGVSKWLRSADDTETPSSTGSTGLVGTPAYASPEQLATPTELDERTDVWSLGVVLYQCLAGRRPFVGPGLPQLCAAILSAEPVDFGPELAVPEELAAIVRRCLRKRPEERYQSVNDLARALRALEGRAERKRRPLVLGVLALAVLVVAGGALAVARVGDEDATAPTAVAREPLGDPVTSAGLASESPRPEPEAESQPRASETDSPEPAASSPALAPPRRPANITARPRRVAPAPAAAPVKETAAAPPADPGRDAGSEPGAPKDELPHLYRR